MDTWTARHFVGAVSVGAADVGIDGVGALGVGIVLNITFYSCYFYWC